MGNEGSSLIRGVVIFALGTIGAMLILLIHSLYIDFIIDDAFISMRYA